MPHIPEEEAIRAVLQALSLDDFLQEQFVLKGGNALKFAFDSPRSSVDVDLSSTEPYPNQEDQETRKFRDEVVERLKAALPKVVSEYRYEEMVLQSSEIKPPNLPQRKFPALEMKVGYTELEDRTPPYSDVVKLEMTLNEVVCEAEYRRTGGFELHVSSLDDIIAEKLRALLQQVTRNRYRPGDVFDIWFFTTRVPQALDRARMARFLQEKSKGKVGDGPVSREMFYHPQVRSRAQEGYDEIEERIPQSVTLPPFTEAFEQVLAFVETLGLPEGRPEDLSD
jgi:predicted nucleotidyltransferase component of viral defense system